MGKREKRAALAERLASENPAGRKVLLGFDGFIDTVVWPVRKRFDAEHFERIGTLAEYGKMIMDASGFSMNVEMVPMQTKLGGNGPILANSLAQAGLAVTYIGALGKDGIREPFEELCGRADVISVCDPGETDAVEFLDGKIISSKLQPLNEMNWGNLKKKVPPVQLAAYMDDSEIIAMVNWTLLNHAQGIWEGILDEVVPLMRTAEPKMVFFDLCDPRKRTEKELLEAVSCMERYASRFDVILGANYQEALQIAQVLGCPVQNGTDALELADQLKKKTKLQRIVVHPVREAVCVSEQGAFRVDGPYCSDPKLTTGAGDNFNAGFLLGKILGMEDEDSLLLGTANSGFYVRNAGSAGYQELIHFLQLWAEGKE